jgi:methyl-accepting chemotaxis protein
MEVEQVSLHSASAAQTVSAAVEEQLAAMEEIAASARKLQEGSNEMRALVNQFKLD